MELKLQRNPGSMLRATLGSQRNTPFISPDVTRHHPVDLIRAYGMWAHRAVTLKAAVAAAIPFRLFTIGNKAAVKHFRQLGPRDLDRRTKAFLSGRMGVRPHGVAAKAMRGNLEEMTEITNHPILDLLTDVNGWDEGYSFLEQVYTDLDIFGSHYAHVVFGRGLPIEFWRLDPTITEPIPSETSYLSHFEYGRGTERQRYEPEDVLWLKLNDPANPWKGYSWVSAWLTTIRASNAIAAFQLWLMTNGGSPDYVVLDKGRKMADPQQKNLFRRMWSRMFGNMTKREHNVAILHGDAEIQRLGDTPRELQFNESETAKRDQIAAASGVPKSFLDLDGVVANSEEGMNQFKTLTIWPIVQRVQDRLNQRLVQPYWGDRLMLVADNPLKEDRALRVQERESQLRTGVTINEIRADDGLDRLEVPEADMPFVVSGVSLLEGMKQQQALGVEGMMAANEAARNPQPPPTDAADEEEPEPEKSWLREMEIRQSPIVSHKALLDGDPAHDEFDGHPNPGFAKALRKAMAGLVQTVIDRLDAIDRKAQFTGTDLDQVMPDGEADEWAKTLEAIAQESIREVVRQSGSAAVTVGAGISFDLTNNRVQRYLEDQSRKIGRQATDTFRKEIARSLLAGVNAGDSTREIAKRIQEIQGAGFVNWKANQIARTETAFAFTHGTIEGWKQSGVVAGKKFLLAPDACPWCEAIAKEYGDGRTDSVTVPLDQPLKALGSVIVGEFPGGPRRLSVDYVDLQGPPIHPHCRCDLVPVLQEQE